MFGEQQTRTLLGPADPARRAADATPRLPAHALIGRAEAGMDPQPVAPHARRARPTRRLVLAGGAVAIAAGAVALGYPFHSSTVDTQQSANAAVAGGPVLVPVAYQLAAADVTAGPKLRALAGSLVDAPYEKQSGRYTYHDIKTYGDPLVTDASNRYTLGVVTDRKVWQAADGTGQQTITQLQPEYPDQASYDYWRNHPAATKPKAGQGNGPLPVNEVLPPLPTTAAQWRDVLRVRSGPEAVGKELARIYSDYAVPRQTRAQILQVLAGVSDFAWRGEVTDQAGRKGVAITYDNQGEQTVLIFNPATGELLADELVTLRPNRVSWYQLILHTDRTSHLG